MILEKDIPKDLLKKAYWFRASNAHVYAVDLGITYWEDGTAKNVKATVSEIDTQYIRANEDWESLKNGDEVFAYSLLGDWVLKIDIWEKYYFPDFNPSKNQWYHKDGEGAADWIEDFTFILKEAYNIAIKASGLKTN